jgi:hypothetical protein
MRALTEDDVRACLANVDDEERRLAALPPDFPLLDFDHVDFLAWRDPRARGRGYLVAELDDRAAGVMLRAADVFGRSRSALCDICHTMQPSDQVTLFSARRPGGTGSSVGSYLCSDLSCHENVRLAAPLAPGEIRSDVNRRIDGARDRAQAFLAGVLEPVGKAP